MAREVHIVLRVVTDALSVFDHKQHFSIPLVRYLFTECMVPNYSRERQGGPSIYSGKHTHTGMVPTVQGF